MWKVLLGQKFITASAVYTVNLILSLKCDLGGRHFVTEEDLQSAVAEFFAKQDGEWYSVGILKLISQYNKCLVEQSDSVEK